MILDPRLVPWGDVLPGVLVSFMLAIFAWGISRWKTWPAIAVFTLTPVIGWACVIYSLNGAIPAIPPIDAPLWALYFAVAGAAMGIVSQWWTICRWSRMITAVLLAAGLAAAIWFLIVGALHEKYLEELTSTVWITLALCGTAVLVTTALPQSARLNAGSRFSPWITGLVIASVCLTLTGTVRLGLLALGLTLTTIPSAIAVLFVHDRVPQNPTGKPACTLDHSAPLQCRQSWIIHLPQAFALPTLFISGPLFASTPWHVTNLALGGVIAGTLAVFAWEIFSRRGPYGDKMGPVMHNVIAIIIGMLITAAPMIVPIKKLLATAAANGFPY